MAAAGGKELTMADIIRCPRCLGTKKEPSSEEPCRFCEGAGYVKIEPVKVETKE